MTSTIHDVANLEKAICTILSEDFRGVKILDVDISDDEDFNGDAILNVKVVFEGDPRDLEGAMLPQVIRHIRPTLWKHAMRAFPTISFISAKDAKVAACI